MAHEIDELAPGIHAYVGAITDPWHKLGVTLNHAFTAEEAMTHAYLGGWDVRKTSVYAMTEDGFADIPERWATVRTNPVTGVAEPLGVVGSQYTPIQNEDNCDLLDALVDESGAHFQTAGALRGGRETFITIKLPESMTIGDDHLDLYVAALNSHDGSSAFRFIVSPVRIVCANTQAAAIDAAKASFSIRHTTGASSAIAEARDALGMTWKYLEGFQAEADRMIATEMTNLEFANIVDGLVNVAGAKTEAQRKRRMQRAGDIRGLYKYADTNASVRGTAWGGYQAVVESIDHLMPVRGTEAQRPVNRALRTVSSSSVRQLKEHAFTAFHSLIPA